MNGGLALESSETSKKLVGLTTGISQIFKPHKICESKLSALGDQITKIKLSHPYEKQL